MGEEWKSVSCGAFNMQGAGRHWTLTCSKLPDFRFEANCTEQEAYEAIRDLQNENRDLAPAKVSLALLGGRE